MDTSMKVNSLFETKQPNDMTASDLPTLQDDPTVKRLTASLEQLAEDEQEVADSLATARTALADAEAHAEDLEIEQYADPDVSEADVQKAQDERDEAQNEVERLEQKAERIGQAIKRVQERRRAEKDGPAGSRMYDDYAAATLATSERAVEVFSEALEALEEMNAVRAKIRHQNVMPPVEAEEPHPGNSYRDENDLRKALTDALETAQAPIERLRKYLNA